MLRKRSKKRGSRELAAAPLCRRRAVIVIISAQSRHSDRRTRLAKVSRETATTSLRSSIVSSSTPTQQEMQRGVLRYIFSLCRWLSHRLAAAESDLISS